MLPHTHTHTHLYIVIYREFFTQTSYPSSNILPSLTILSPLLTISIFSFVISYHIIVLPLTSIPLSPSSSYHHVHPLTLQSSSPSSLITHYRRRGGAFKPTSDGRWAHVFCARHAPGHTKICQETGVIDVRMIPKECKKTKCVVCNRQQGACVRCVYLGCTNYFHPLCVERGGKGYVRTRFGEKEAYCHEHIPESVDRLHDGGYLVDGGEVGLPSLNPSLLSSLLSFL